jgi:putative DNA primase/helicase
MLHHEEESAIKHQLADRADAIARLILGEPNRALSTRRQLRFGNYGSVAVEIDGPKAGYWYDHSDDTGGDLLGLIQRETKIDFPGALKRAADLLGETVEHTSYRSALRKTAAPDTIDADKQRKKALSLNIWETSQAAAGSVVQLYLEQRNLFIPEGVSDVRFHPSCPRGSDRVPAMVAAMRNIATGELVGIHRTFLNADGTKAKRYDNDKAKAMLGYAGAIMLCDFADVGLNLFIAEGIETALTCL